MIHPIILLIVSLIILLTLVMVTYAPVTKNQGVAVGVKDVKRPSINQLTEYYGDIGIEPYGCFSSLDEKFFQKEYNEYTKSTNSLLILDNTDKDIQRLVVHVINNGYDIYGFKMLHKYDPDKYKDISIEEIAVLGKLSGYNYLSVFKFDEKSRGKMYLSYSPPMDEILEQFDEKNLSKPKETKYHSLTPKLNQYTNEEEKAPGKELSCGYPCTYKNKPVTFKDPNGNVRQYMCGSVGYPNIKTPARFAVYKIVEK
jgi:hypothetical protein